MRSLIFLISFLFVNCINTLTVSSTCFEYNNDMATIHTKVQGTSVDTHSCNELLNSSDREIDCSDLNLGEVQSLRPHYYVTMDLCNRHITTNLMATIASTQSLLQDLSFAGSKFDSDALVHLKGLKKLQYISFEDSTLTDGDIESAVYYLTELKELNLSHTQVTSRGIKLLGNLSNLENLSCKFIRLDEDSFNTILQFSELRSLWVIGCGLADIDCYALRQKEGLARVILQ